MKIDSAAAVGLVGIQKGMQGMRESAASIASEGTTSLPDARNLTEALLTLKQQEMQVSISAKVIEHANEAIGTMLDVLA